MEEKKFSPAGYRSWSKDFHGLTGITDPRSEKRKAFMEIPLQNPIERLSEKKVKKDRERMQKELNETGSNDCQPATAQKQYQIIQASNN